MTARVLIAGVGNVFFGDDGFGVEVARALAGESLPEGVEVEDFGIRGIHLAFRLLEPIDRLIVVDAVSRGGAPGTLYVIEPDLSQDDVAQGEAGAHGMDLRAVFAQVRAMGGVLPPVRLIGCEPETVGVGMALSAAVRAAIPGAVALVREQLGAEVVEKEAG